ncbi:MAG: RDD family protein [Bacteroidales bacterium]|nr:RDD family protein [Bacteroidales bacterium]
MEVNQVSFVYFGLFLIVGIILKILYKSILESSKLMATLGKWFFGIQVTDKQGDRISFLQALVRNILKDLTVLTIIGLIISAFTSAARNT